jgi:hypothetical protein
MPVIHIDEAGVHCIDDDGHHEMICDSGYLAAEECMERFDDPIERERLAMRYRRIGTILCLGSICLVVLAIYGAILFFEGRQ